MLTRDHFVYVPSQWQTMLQCNVVCHWLGAYTKLSQVETAVCAETSGKVLLKRPSQHRRHPNIQTEVEITKYLSQFTQINATESQWIFCTCQASIAVMAWVNFTMILQIISAINRMNFYEISSQDTSTVTETLASISSHTIPFCIKHAFFLMKISAFHMKCHWMCSWGSNWWCVSISSGPVFCLLLGVTSGYAQPITGQVTSVTWPVIGWA